jgi:hypothetical protein
VLELNPSGWRCVGLVVANTHMAQEEVTEMPCSDLLAIHHRKCMHGRMEIF